MSLNRKKSHRGPKLLALMTLAIAAAAAAGGKDLKRYLRIRSM